MPSEKIDIKAKDADGGEHDVRIEADDATGKGTITLDGEEVPIWDPEKSADGRKVKCRGLKKGLIDIEVSIDITIDCSVEPPTITIVVTKGPVTLDTRVYTFDHAQQDKLIAWVKKRKIKLMATSGQGPGQAA
ncbi:MAG: hypothetical protein AAB412_00945 [Elusimicrobiota bacterium]